MRVEPRKFFCRNPQFLVAVGAHNVAVELTCVAIVNVKFGDITFKILPGAR